MAYEIKRNDRRPFWRVRLTANDQPVDLTGAFAVRFTMKSGATIKVNKAPMVIVDALIGEVEYRWAAGDTNTADTYTAEVEVDWGTATDSSTQSFPSTGYFTIKINEDLA